MRPLSFPLGVTAAFVRPLPFPITSGAAVAARLGRVLLRPGLGGGPGALLFLLLFLLLLFTPEGLRLELVPLAADVFESVVQVC